MTVYVVGHSPRTGPVKIGYTGDVEDRLRALRRGESCPLTVHQRFSSTRPVSELMLLHSIEGDRGLERALHMRLKEFRIEGEWFSLGTRPDEVIEMVEKASDLTTLTGNEWRTFVDERGRSDRAIVDLPGAEWSAYLESRRKPKGATVSELEIRERERGLLADLIEARYELAPNADQREALRGVLEVIRPELWRSGKGS